MYDEALVRIADADALAQRVNTSDSSAILRILGFEILLKCALRLAGVSETKTHDYSKLWGKLPAPLQSKLLFEAGSRMPGHANLSDIHRLLNWYQFIFERARYHYELYEGYTDGEMAELGLSAVSLFDGGGFTLRDGRQTTPASERRIVASAG